jgi:N-ethylmaleimide reductase
MPALCPSGVPVNLERSGLDKIAPDKILDTPKATTMSEMDQAVANFVRGVTVAEAAGFEGVQLLGAHDFLLPQFLCSWTSRRSDDYGGTLEKRMKFLK